MRRKRLKRKRLNNDRRQRHSVRWPGDTGDSGCFASLLLRGNTIGKSPAFQLYASDFYMDTAGWTVAQVGAYTRLLMYEWVNGPIPSDMASLSRIAGISDARTMYKMWGILGQKFISLNGNEHGKFTEKNSVTTVGNICMSNGGNLLYNKRLEEERDKQDKRREIQAEKGLSGATKRWKDHIAPAIAQALPNDSSSSSSSSSLKIKNKTYSEFFLNFWDQYPNKKGKEEAFKAWKKHAPNMEVVIKAVIAQKEEKASLTLEGKFCPEWPNASTWLNNKRWEDEIQEVPKPKIEGDYPRAEDVLRKQGFGEDYFK